MLRILAVALLLSPALAGCMGGGDQASPSPTVPTEAAWELDCTLGELSAGEWPQECLVRASYSPATKAEMWLKINPTDPDNVVVGVKDNHPDYSDDCTWNGVYLTHDAARTWEEVHIGGPYDQRMPGEPYWGYGCNTDPMFVFGADGTLYYGVEMYSLGVHQYDATMGLSPLPQGWKVLLTRSNDGGLTWEEPITFHEDKGTVTDYARMAVSPTTGTILEAINSIDAGAWCHVVASRDQGQSAEPPVKVTPEQFPGTHACKTLAVSPEGTITVGFVGPDPEDPQPDEFGGVFLARSTDDGATFLDTNPGFSFQALPESFEETEHRSGAGFMEMAYDLTDGPNRGTLYVVYQSWNGNDADVFLRKSVDDGRTWSQPVLVHEQSEHHQYMANLVVADDGSVHTIFFDRRWDPDNRLNDVTWSHSTDGGETWTDQRVTTVSWDGDLGVHQEKRPFIGDYLGIDAVGDDVWFAVPDTSLGGEPVVAVGHATRPG